MQKRVAILEIGGSHDECILSQLIGLKAANCWIVFCGTREMLKKNSQFEYYIDAFHEVKLPRSTFGDFFEMVRLNKWFSANAIDIVIANTAQGGHIRNLCLTARPKVKFFGIIHTIKMLNGSVTQSLISRKINQYFVLNDTLKKRVKEKPGIQIHSFYPLSYPHFDQRQEKGPGEFRVAIIGGVENRRKDLDGFLAMAQTTPKHVQFYFLGKSNPGSDEVKVFEQRLEELQLTDRVQLFHEFVSEESFDACLQQTDAIFPLVHPGTPSADEYFSRQISGAINIAFSYKIPMMIHEHYQDWEDFQSGVAFYNLTNFPGQFSTFLSDHQELKQQLVSNPKFSSEIQNQQFARVVLQG